MQPMVSKMLGADGVTAGSVLLVDSVNNRTNGSLNAAEATETLRNALANNGKFTPRFPPSNCRWRSNS